MMYCILAFAQDGCKITGASNMSSMPVVDVHVMVLMFNFEFIVSAML